jgi:hypothetical protein
MREKSTLNDSLFLVLLLPTLLRICGAQESSAWFASFKGSHPVSAAKPLPANLVQKHQSIRESGIIRAHGTQFVDVNCNEFVVAGFNAWNLMEMRMGNLKVHRPTCPLFAT